MPYQMNQQEQCIWNHECNRDRTLKKYYVGIKYVTWQEGNDWVFTMDYIPNFKKIWIDYCYTLKKIKLPHDIKPEWME